MAEGPGQEHSEEGAAPPPELAQAPAEIPNASRPAGASWRPTLWLATVLGLGIAGVALSPFWATKVAPLFPWGEGPAAPAPDYAAFAARLDAIERRPAVPTIDVDAIKSAESALARRIDRLETARNADRQTEVGVAAIRTGLQQLEDRLGAIEAQSASRAATEAAEVQKVRQELTRVGSIAADLADRLPAIERQVRLTGGAVRIDAALLVGLLQMREAVEAARPFTVEYDAFIALARDQPDLIAAAQPLAGAAQAGVAGRAVLSERLAELAGRIVPATAPPVGSDLGAQALAWLRSLVTIRRIDGASQTGSGAMSVAEIALARGDLSGAVSALQTLSGPNSGATHSWLEMAQQRLAAEAALAHLQELLVVRLGTPPEAPGSAPAEAPAKSRAPS